MTKAEKLTKAILSSMGKEGDPIGVLVEAVLEKEFKSYDDLLMECKNRIDSCGTSDRFSVELIEKIGKKLNEDNSKFRGPVSS